MPLNQQAILYGTVIAFAANSAPSGYLLCNGAAVSRTTYAALYAKIGTLYGSGNGSSTFNLPNLANKFVMGSGTAGTVKSAGLPNITGTGDASTNINTSATTGAFYVASNSGTRIKGTSSSDERQAYGFDASLSNSIYGNSSTVQPPALTMRFYIKH